MASRACPGQAEVVGQAGRRGHTEGTGGHPDQLDDRLGLSPGVVPRSPCCPEIRRSDPVRGGIPTFEGRSAPR